MTASALLAAALGMLQQEQAPHGLGIIGMAVLVAVLVALGVLLPRLQKRHPEPDCPPPPTEEEVMAAVCAIHATFSSLDQMEHVHMTWRMYEKPYRPWRLAGRAEFLMGKQSVHTRARNRSK